MSNDKVIDIKTGKVSKKGHNRKVKAELWDKMFQLMKAGLLGVVIADTRLTKAELDAMVEVWLEEIVLDSKAKKRWETTQRLRKRRAIEKETKT